MAAEVLLLAEVNSTFAREDHTIRMANDFCDDCHAPGSDLPVQSFEEIQSSNDQLPSPSFIAKTMIPELFPCERRDRARGIPDKAPSGVGVES